MIILTGGAGMIGSMIAWHLNTILNKDQFVIVDEFLVPEQEKNIDKRDFIDLIGKNELPNYLKSNSQIEAIIHMGAISATTENNFNNLLKSNIRYSQFLWDWASANQVPLIYASSAATYGDGEFGYKDNSDALLNYKPLNAYGYSKHFFDMWVQNQLQQNLPKPPKWFGLKFFNVYGPNEYHKGRMASVVYHAFNQFKKDGEVRLFKSKNPEYKDGMQLRDFIYVKDAVRCIFHLLESTNKSGLYNIGTGQAQSFKDLANALLINLKEPESLIKYVDMPKDLENKYQYYTEADIKKLRDSEYDLKFNNLLEGVSDYVQNYLLQPDQYA
jgi:ADP-L-glycero-D-manno-heptose 6-epimerase